MTIEKNPKTVARVWSQYEQVKEHVASLHMTFVDSVVKLQAAVISKRKNSAVYKEQRLRAFQSLSHLRHFGVLSGAILDRDDKKLKDIDGYLKKWDDVTDKELMEVMKQFENWLAESYFYDVRISDDNREIIDIQGTLKAAGL